MTFHVITLFPHAFDSYLGESILKRALEDGKIKVQFYNPRDYAENRWKRARANANKNWRSVGRVDRAPYGGGPGMVIQPFPVIRAMEAALRTIKKHSHILKNVRMLQGVRIVWLSPSGKQFTNETGVKYAKHSDIIIICGRYEGIDARVKRVVQAMRISEPFHHPVRRGGHPSSGRRGGMPRIKLEEISVGPFVLTGGELPAMILIDVIARQVSGVLGNEQSREETRIASPDVYTRPEVFEYRGKKFRVPKILLTGNHARITEWRQTRKGRG